MTKKRTGKCYFTDINSIFNFCKKILNIVIVMNFFYPKIILKQLDESLIIT